MTMRWDAGGEIRIPCLRLDMAVNRAVDRFMEMAKPVYGGTFQNLHEYSVGGGVKAKVMKEK